MHTCFLVPDLEASVAELRELAGLRFRKVARIPFTLRRGERTVELTLSIAYTLDGALELVQATDSEPFRLATPRAVLHHTGYAVADLEAAVAEHRARGYEPGWRVEVGGRLLAVFVDGGPCGPGPVEIQDARFVSGPDAWNERVAPGIG